MNRLAKICLSVGIVCILNSGFSFAMLEGPEVRREEKIDRPIKVAVPEVAHGYEDIYERFLKGVLVYKPKKDSDEGKVEMRIADFPNPLEGTFDLSQCGDASKYLSISTGYRKEKMPENANKVEIWFAPRFLIEKNLPGSASHFKDIMGSWDTIAHPVGTFFTSGGCDDLGCYNYATKLSWEAYNDNHLYRTSLSAKQHIPRRVIITARTLEMNLIRQNFFMSFLSN